MLGLTLRIGFANGWPGQPIAGVQLVKQPLALPNAQLNLIALFQTLSQGLAVP